MKKPILAAIAVIAIAAICAVPKNGTSAVNGIAGMPPAIITSNNSPIDDNPSAFIDPGRLVIFVTAKNITTTDLVRTASAALAESMSIDTNNASAITADTPPIENTADAGSIASTNRTGVHRDPGRPVGSTA